MDHGKTTRVSVWILEREEKNIVIRVAREAIIILRNILLKFSRETSIRTFKYRDFDSRTDIRQFSCTPSPLSPLSQLFGVGRPPLS